jgi:two-component system, OmpR family, sensor kinase
MGSMFDLVTALASISIVGSSFAVAWMIAALILNRQFGSAQIAAGFVLISSAGIAVSLRGTLPVAWYVSLETVFVLSGTMFLTLGVMVLLDQSPLLSYVKVAFSPLIASVFLPALFPADAGIIHIHIITLGGVAMAGFVCCALWRVRGVSTYLRIALGTPFVLEAAAVLLRSHLATITPEVRADYMHDKMQAWFFLQGSMFLPVVGLLLFLILVFHLTASLKNSNDVLVDEVARRRKTQRELAVALESEKALRDEQKTFLRLFSHEVRTPIAMIGRSTEMLHLLLEGPAANVTERLENIQSATQRLYAVAEKFLVADQDKSGSVKIAKLSVPDLFADVRRHFSASEFGDRLRWSMPDDTPFFMGDREMLNTALINLIDNALKFSSAERAVDVRASASSAHVVFEVLDRGIGIPPEEQEEVGKKYFRGERAASVPGSGLGLFSALKLLSYHDADLQLRAREGGGTVASILVPLDRRATNDDGEDE